MEVRFTEHGYSEKLASNIPKRLIDKSIEKAKKKGKFPQNRKVYIYDKQHIFYIVGCKKKNIFNIITIVEKALNGMNIYGRDPVIRVV